MLLIPIGNGVQSAIQVKEQAFYGWESLCHARSSGYNLPELQLK